MIASAMSSETFRRGTPTCSPATSAGSRCRRPGRHLRAWDEASTYVRKPRTSTACPTSRPGHRHRGRAGAGSSLATRSRPTTSARPVRSRRTPRRKYLAEHGVAAGLQLLRLAPRQPRGDDPRHVRQHPAAQPARAGTEGGFTRDFTNGGDVPRCSTPSPYAAAGTPLVVLAGREYGSGSSRDWAARAPALLGVKAVIAESYERIHRSNLIGMGVVPLQFPQGRTASRWA